MYRIDSVGSVDGRFQEGNPAIGQKATLLPADWLNEVQEELAYLIEQVGIALVKGDRTQVYDAIVALVTGAVGDGSGAVPVTRQVTGGGLVTGGGALANDLVLTVLAASVAEVQAQVVSNKVVTPAAMAGLISLTEIGGAWVIRIGTTVVQLFGGTAQGNATTVLSLPQAFPGQCRFAMCNGGAIDTDAQDNFPYVSGRGLTTVSVFNARNTSVPVDVLAWGN